MIHPLKIWLSAAGKSVMAFCEGQPFSYPTVYKLLKGEGGFDADTLIAIASATNDEVSVATLIETLQEQRAARKNAAAVEPSRESSEVAP